jgi:hypothetical protein
MWMVIGKGPSCISIRLLKVGMSFPKLVLIKQNLFNVNLQYYLPAPYSIMSPQLPDFGFHKPIYEERVPPSRAKMI